LQSHNSSIHKTCLDSCSRKGAYRFLSNPKVSESLLIQSLEDQCKANSEGKRVIAFCDTSTFNFTAHKGRIKDFTGLGSLGSCSGIHPLGFLIHPILVHQQSSGAPCGISAVKLWTRPEEAKRKRSKRHQTQDLPIEDKESYKWLGPCLSSREGSLSTAEHITFVMDREGDIMEVYDRLPNAKTDVLVRACHNRNIVTPEQGKEKLFDYVSKQPVSGTDTINVQGKKRKKRKADVGIKYAKCTLNWHGRQKVNSKINPNGIEVTIIEVKEKTHKGYKEEPLLIWRLITTKNIENIEQAKEEIRIYAQRWRIEEYFKLLKSDGYNIESTELESGTSIRKLTLILMKVSIKIQQLKAARDGTTEIQVADVFNEKEIECLELINEDVSGNTIKQMNPHDPKNLAWATWIIARLGGWKEFYNKKRPPGHKTLIGGMDKFEGIMIGYSIFKNKDVSQR
jgi:hypothetical protein